MTVAQLIELLRTQPQDLLVVCQMYSEYCLIDAEQIQVKELCKTRQDGWVANKRLDKPTQLYLAFPGN
jgi:hypothetical protein